MLTELQKEELRGLEVQFSGRIPGLEYDQVRHDTILFGTEKQKLQLLSEKKDQLLQDLKEHKTRLEKELQNINAKIEELTK